MMSTPCLYDSGLPTYYGRNNRFCQFWSDTSGTHVIIYGGVGRVLYVLYTKDIVEAHEFILRHLGPNITV